MESNATLKYDTKDRMLKVVVEGQEIPICKAGNTYNGSSWTPSAGMLRRLSGKYVLLVDYAQGCWLSDISSATLVKGHLVDGDRKILYLTPDLEKILKGLIKPIIPDKEIMENG